MPGARRVSFGDLLYAKKLPHYVSQNLLARSLHLQCYDHTPGFLAYVERSGLALQPRPDFKNAGLL